MTTNEEKIEFRDWSKKLEWLIGQHRIRDSLRGWKGSSFNPCPIEERLPDHLKFGIDRPSAKEFARWLRATDKSTFLNTWRDDSKTGHLSPPREEVVRVSAKFGLFDASQGLHPETYWRRYWSQWYNGPPSDNKKHPQDTFEKFISRYLEELENFISGRQSALVFDSPHGDLISVIASILSKSQVALLALAELLDRVRKEPEPVARAVVELGFRAGLQNIHAAYMDTDVQNDSNAMSIMLDVACEFVPALAEVVCKHKIGDTNGHFSDIDGRSRMVAEIYQAKLDRRGAAYRLRDGQRRLPDGRYAIPDDMPEEGIGGIDNKALAFRKSLMLKSGKIDEVAMASVIPSYLEYCENRFDESEDDEEYTQDQINENIRYEIAMISIDQGARFYVPMKRPTNQAEREQHDRLIKKLIDLKFGIDFVGLQQDHDLRMREKKRLEKFTAMIPVRNGAK